MDLTVRCQCGKVLGTITGATPSSTNPTICDCRWCQWYAQALGRDGEMLDEHGGTTVVMVSPARLRFTAGRDQIACGRMSSKGPLRWHTACCKTPLANTIRPTIPFMAVHPMCIEQPVADFAGPVRGRINSKMTGAEARAAKANRLSQALMLTRLAGMLGAWWLQGAHNKHPFPEAEPTRLPRPEA